ncbi:MAG: hypothetical protein LBG97_00990 [Coriobacteriales bacterium]|jgi:cytoskeletal protein CcmA (bactofilin family)|nr:hypothetical protein [Coriobacteriales bacterium]
MAREKHNDNGKSGNGADWHYKVSGNMGKGHIDGVITFPGGEFEDLRISGVTTCEGDIVAKRMDIDGVATFKGNVLCTDFDCDGVTTVEGCVKATTADIDGVTTINGDKLEADRIRCDGVISVNGQVSADVITAAGFINAKEIVGDSITIHSFRKSFVFKLWLKFKEAIGSDDFSKVELIEATTVDLRGVRAKIVSGENVKIGPGCVIGRVDCTNELEIDPDAEVKEVVKG